MAVPPKSKAPTTIGVMLYRKAKPQEILFQLEPVLRRAGLLPHQIISLLEKPLAKSGFKVFLHDLSDSDCTGDWRFLTITDAKEGVPETATNPRAARWMRPSEIIRWSNGGVTQGFRLIPRGRHLAPKPVETLYVPDNDGFHTGELVECAWDELGGTWTPTGKSKTVSMPWNQDSLANRVGGDSAK
ncbi:MAG: hypothetical protein AB9869_35085 [Verrucomicrobiia bacterium]